MADTINVEPSTASGAVPIAVDQVGSDYYPLYKPVVGPENAVPVAVSSANPMPMALTGVTSATPLPVEQVAGTLGKPQSVEDYKALNIQLHILTELKKISFGLQLIHGQKITDRDVGD